MRRPPAPLASAAVAGLLLTGSLFAQNNSQFSDPNVEDLRILGFEDLRI